MSDTRVRSVAIVGGGTAGWFAAAALGFVLGPQRAQVRVIETPGSAEERLGAHAAIPPVRVWHNRLGFDENDLLRKTQGAFSLGVEYRDWTRAGRAYFHAYGEIGAPFDGLSFHHHWLKLRQSSDAKLTDYSVGAVMAKRGRFARPANDPSSVLSTYGYGLHLDAALYQRSLRAFAESKGVAAVSAGVRDVRLRAGDGYIEAVELDNGERVEADLFIDCTPEGRLIGDALGVAHEDWSALMPCDRVAAIECENASDLVPFSRATAREAGWQWRAPTQKRIANASFYCSRFQSDDEAASKLLASLDGKAIGEPRLTRLASGVRGEFWKRNCVSLGPAAGDLEPIDAANLHLLHRSITRLVDLFPDRECRPRESAEYNRLVRNEFERVRDMAALHYHANEREEPFWAERRAAALPETLQRKLKLFRSRGRVVLLDEETFLEANWVSVFVGQNVLPDRGDPLIESVDAERMKNNLARMRTMIAQAAETVPTHRAYVEAHCAAPSEARA
ncbi:MAG: tryptophan halogenase family protein [Terricaulis sp.]